MFGLPTFFFFFFFNDTATTEIYTLSLHDALPIYLLRELLERGRRKPGEDQRRFYEFEGRTRRKPRACEGFRSSTKLRHGKFRDRRRRRMQDILNGRDAGDGLLGEDTELQG